MQKEYPMKKTLALVLFLCVMLCGCTDKELTGLPPSVTNPATGETAPPVDVDFAQTDADMFTERDSSGEYSEKNSVIIKLRGDTAAASDSSVQISGSTMTLTKEGVYLISGSLNDGTLIVDADDSAKLQLVFKGVSIQSSTTAALQVKNADKVFVTLAEGTKSTLRSDALSEESVDAAVFSRVDLTLNGAGSLTVTSPAGHAVTAKDDLAITGGSYTLTCAGHGLDANDSVRIQNGNLTITAGKDGIHAENTEDATLGFVYISGGTVKAQAEGDGISAGAYLQITGGNFDILAGGGSVNGSKDHSDNWGGPGGPGGPGGRPGRRDTQTTTEDTSTSMKGIKAVGSLLISGGTFTMDCADDAVHSDVSVVINGGSFTIATGDDGFHAEDTLTFTAGTVVITESYEGLEAQHIQVQGGDIRLVSSDDGLNAAGGMDSSGTEGGRDGMYGGPGGGPGGPGGMGGAGNGSIVISGGTLYVNASGDGIDANGTLTISGGHTTVVGPTQGNTATLDFDGSAVITGGTFIGTGAAGMAQTFSGSEQGVISVSVGNQPAGTKITLTDADGNEVISYTPELNFAVVILSTPQMEKGKTYTIQVGEQSASFEAS